jgi:ketosteroid isomerase-like protein
MAGNVEILKKGYEDFSKGDIDSALEPWPDDFVWDGGDTDLPGGGVHESKDEARQTLERAVGAWDKFQLTVDEIHEGDNDTVFALGHTDVSKDGKDARLPVVHVWRFEGGQPKRIQILTDTYTSAKLLGKA